MTIATVNPATGQIIRTFTPLSEQELDARLQCAADAFRRYSRTPIGERTRMLQRAAEILDADKEKFARIMVTEMGKTLKAAVEEAEKCAWGCRYYAEQAERFLSDEVVETNASRSFVTYQPIGPVLAIMPWNFPFWQVFRFAAPALGGKRGSPQTRVQCPPVRSRDPGHLPASRISRGLLPDPADRDRPGPASH